jgi:type I restriction enzyme S subunit
VSRIDNLIAKLCPDGVEFKFIGEIAKCYAGATPASSVAAYWEGGTIPWMTSGEVNKGTVYDTDKKITQVGYDSCSTKFMPPNIVVIALAGQGKTRGTVARTRISLCTNQSLCSIISDESVDSNFLYYYLQTQYQQLRSVSAGDGGRGGLNLKIIRSYRVPIPPVEVQRDIVRVLDLFTEREVELEAELEAEVAARQAQHAHYRNQILGLAGSANFDDNEVPLSELVEFINGKPHERLVVPDGSIALLTARFISTAGRSTRWVNPEGALTPARRGDIAMVMSDLPNGRALARCFYVEEDAKYTANQRVCLLRVKDDQILSARYLYRFLDRNPQLLAFDNGQDQTHLKKGQILGIKVPLISLVAQDRATATLDTLDVSTRDLVSDLQSELNARRKQYEHCRDRMLTFKELVA